MGAVVPKDQPVDIGSRGAGVAMRQGAALAGFVAVCFAAALVGGLLTSTSVETWYPGLAKPSWNPPSWVFGPVWSVLYAAMAVAAWLVWRRGGGAARVALAVFGVQLALNVAWSGLFFALRSPGLAFAELIVLWIAIAATLVLFARWNRLAGALFVPYLAWVTFAGALNFAIWRLNP